MQGKLPVVSARVSPTLVLRAPVVVLGVGTAASRGAVLHPRQVSQMSDTVIDVISEAAVRLLEEQGFENYDEAGVAAVVQAVEAANADSNFAQMTVEVAVDLAQSTAAADPMVQMALQDNKITPTVTPTAGIIRCIGDCSGTQTVAVNDVITLANIALGTAQPSECSHGIPTGTSVDISLIVRAVNSALHGCP